MKSILLFVFLFCALLNGQQGDFVHINFKTADSIALVQKGQSLENLPLLTHKLTADLSTDVEKFRAIYIWVCSNIENDFKSYLTTSRKRKKLSKDREALVQWNKNFTPKVFQKLVSQKKTACTGYAYLLREMANLAGIKCKIINGYGRTANINLDNNSLPNHSWNAVELNEKWYLCDSTWSSGLIVIEDNVPIFRKDYFNGYFLPEPDLFIKNHYPIDEEWTLLSGPPTLSQFLESPIIYKEAFLHSAMPIVPHKMRVIALKKEIISFKISLPDTPVNKSISLILVQGNFKKIIIPNKIVRNKKEVIIQHSFEKNGLYDVHIQIDEDPVASYVVKVKNK